MSFVYSDDAISVTNRYYRKKSITLNEVLQVSELSEASKVVMIVFFLTNHTFLFYFRWVEAIIH